MMLPEAMRGLAKAFNHPIHKSDTGPISQLTALLASEQPESRVLDALRSLAPFNDTYM